jgi:hypothetical protein
MFEGPTIIDKEIQCGTAQDAEDIGGQIIDAEQFSQNPQDGDIGQHGGAGSYMVLKHSLEIFPFPFLAPVVPGPESIQHEVIQKRYLNRYEAGEKIEEPHSLGEEPEEKHVDHESPGSHQAEFCDAPYVLSVNYGIDSGVQILIPQPTSLPSDFRRTMCRISPQSEERGSP